MTRIEGPDGKWVEIENLSPKGTPERQQQIEDAINAKYYPEKYAEQQAQRAIKEQTQGFQGTIESGVSGIIEGLPLGNLLNRGNDYLRSGFHWGLNQLLGTDYITDPDQIKQYRQAAIEASPTAHNLGIATGAFVPGGLLAKGAQLGTKAIQQGAGLGLGQKITKNTIDAAEDFVNKGSNVAAKAGRAGLLTGSTAAVDAAGRETGEQIMSGDYDPNKVVEQGLLGGTAGFVTGGLLQGGSDVLSRGAGKAQDLLTRGVDSAVTSTQKRNPLLAGEENETMFDPVWNNLVTRNADDFQGPLLANPHLPTYFSHNIYDIIQNGTDAQKRKLAAGLDFNIRAITDSDYFRAVQDALRQANVSKADVDSLVKRRIDIEDDIFEASISSKEALMTKYDIPAEKIPVDIRQLDTSDLPVNAKDEMRKAYEKIDTIANIIGGGADVVTSLAAIFNGTANASTVQGLMKLARGLNKNNRNMERAAIEAENNELLREVGIAKILRDFTKLANEANALNEIIPDGNFSRLSDTMAALDQMEVWRNALGPGGARVTPEGFRQYEQDIKEQSAKGLIAKGATRVLDAIANRPGNTKNQNRDAFLDVILTHNIDDQMSYIGQLANKSGTRNPNLTRLEQAEQRAIAHQQQVDEMVEARIKSPIRKVITDAAETAQNKQVQEEVGKEIAKRGILATIQKFGMPAYKAYLQARINNPNIGKKARKQAQKQLDQLNQGIN